jgi:hypothetical protein
MLDMKNPATGNPIDRGDGIKGRRLVLILVAALALGAVFLAATLLMAGCSGEVSAALRADGGARVSIQAEVPSVLAAKFRKLAQGAGDQAVDASAPLFEADAIKKTAAERPWMRVASLSRPTAESIKAEFEVLGMDKLAASKDLAGTGFLTLSKGSGWSELKIKLDRGSAAAAAKLFPGLDPYLMDALSPPALEEDPVTAAEYRTMLKSVLGEKAMPAMEAAAISVSLSAPGKVIESAGGSLAGGVLKAKIPIIDALVLERPIEIRLRWAQ